MSNAQTKLNLSEIIEDIFLILTNKEKDVIVQRFSLDNKPRRTLESIGQQFSVTRERVRQIEKIALSKLKRTVQTTRLNSINEIADRVITENGGVILERKLVIAILNEIDSANEVDSHIIKLALSINASIEKFEKTNFISPFWKSKALSIALVNSIVSSGIKILKKKSDVMQDAKLVVQIRQMMDEALKNFSDALIVSSLEVDKRIKRLKGEFGLMAWRHINPRSIRDKAYIVLKNEKKPLHFVEIANKITASGFDKKVVTTQAVHNELIRYDQFVLVGRGLYALKEFGYEKGTVSDIIANLLKSKSPMTKQEIIDGVLKQRHVKKGTISLNLQKNPQFVRVGRAVYKLDLKRKK
ncbi:MAG: sigma factor-like helix-turn-helix DNA-binding protein [Candidatus Gracilibacteria bacterium]|nr:sigma factor-like helix-turn-helix DNA-binding protein [Candidatus Gracilibacteria bacterium]